MNQPAAEATGERLPQPQRSNWSAVIARDSYVLLAGFVVLLALGRAAGMGLATALAGHGPSGLPTRASSLWACWSAPWPQQPFSSAPLAC